MKIIEKEFNVITGETTVIERDETAEETKARLDRAAKIEAEQAEAAAREAQRQALLNRLGITEEEARILLGGN